MAKKRSWIKAAVIPAHKGDFAAKAKAAGVSTAEFARKHADSPGKLGKQARLAMTLMSLHGGGESEKPKPRSMGNRMKSRYGGAEA